MRILMIRGVYSLFGGLPGPGRLPVVLIGDE